MEGANPLAAPQMEHSPDRYTQPLFRRYFELANEYSPVIILMRVGDFYEAYGRYAVVLSEVLGITLTKRTATIQPVNGEAYSEDVAMSGLPHHSLERFITKLIHAGYRAAVVEGMNGDVNERRFEEPPFEPEQEPNLPVPVSPNFGDSAIPLSLPAEVDTVEELLQAAATVGRMHTASQWWVVDLCRNADRLGVSHDLIANALGRAVSTVSNVWSVGCQVMPEDRIDGVAFTVYAEAFARSGMSYSDKMAIVRMSHEEGWSASRVRQAVNARATAVGLEQPKRTRSVAVAAAREGADLPTIVDVQSDRISELEAENSRLRERMGMAAIAPRESSASAMPVAATCPRCGNPNAPVAHISAVEYRIECDICDSIPGDIAPDPEPTPEQMPQGMQGTVTVPYTPQMFVEIAGDAARIVSAIAENTIDATEQSIVERMVIFYYRSIYQSNGKLLPGYNVPPHDDDIPDEVPDWS